ncbi:AbrB/MazE/SpoVT family DNA-binding domain-containing protein [Conexivisphaera calida]|uniref:Phosphate regulatory protein-like n=1 Tax=Conexivisphaera calida TaxID=1874277 RepID=A0A4P2VLL1_9ARCH|nr:AbrB/MazE/SpoVT family DNA-binding domain-containing protein [Conexivisphaera calida]BBE42008.1 Phosphate regulatory protein-like [Conexivisphaera calida]
MKSRKLVRLGSSLFVSIPAEWTKSLGLREGSEVAMDLDGEHVVLRPLSGPEKERASIGPPAAHRKLLAAYLNGCSEIRVDLAGLGREEVERVEEMAASLIGLEKVYQGSDSVLYACFVDDDQNPASVSNRIVDTLSTMIVDAAGALDSADPGKLAEVAARDSVVNKLYFLLVRVLRSTVELPRAKLMDFRAMSKILERMGDEISGLAAGAPASWDPMSLGPDAEELAGMLREAHGLFIGGGTERAEELGNGAWTISCQLHRESMEALGFASRAYRSYSVVAALIKDVTDLVV